MKFESRLDITTDIKIESINKLYIFSFVLVQNYDCPYLLNLNIAEVYSEKKL
mgnify:CR=1 FL=1